MVTFFELANKLLSAVMVSDLDSAVACANKVHGHAFFLEVILLDDLLVG